jgi:hypothetical protein
MKTTSSRIAFVALAAMMTLSACASGARYATEDFASDRGVGVEVSNHNWMDIVIYAVSGGNRVRLGTVTTGLDGRFSLPKSMNVQTGNLFLEAHPIGSGEVFRSDPIMVNPGSRILWSLENQLSLSSHRVAMGK